MGARLLHCFAHTLLPNMSKDIGYSNLIGALMPRGQPTLYKPEYCEELISHMEKGLSFESFGAIANCCADTLYEWVKVHPEFSDARKTAIMKCRIFWEKIGMNGMAGKIKNFQAAIWIFNMKNRFHWSDRQEINANTFVLAPNRKRAEEKVKDLLKEKRKWD